MLLSVCVPVYNHDVLPLVRRLSSQASELGGEAEVVCIDDGSEASFRQHNRAAAELARWVELPHNVGRARVRNLFLQHTEGSYLIFVDNDLQVPPDFLQAYAQLAASDDAPAVVVGGHRYDRRCNNPQHRLRYLYGTQVECRSLSERRREPYRSFMSGNFMVRRDVLQKHPFEESIRRYGYEDVLFGYRLQQHGIEVLHVDNAVVNSDVETNEEFLCKTQEAIGTLAELYLQQPEDEGFCQSVRLLSTYKKIKNRGLIGVVHSVFRMLRTPLESHFIAGNTINMSEFSFYKLGLLCEEVHESRM